MPQFVQHEDITKCLGALVFGRECIALGFAYGPIKAIDQGFEVFGFELIEATQVSDDLLTHRACIGPKGLDELEITSSA